MLATDYADARRIVRRCYLGNATVTELRRASNAFYSLMLDRDGSFSRELPQPAFDAFSRVRVACYDAELNSCQFTLREAGAAISQALAFC